MPAPIDRGRPLTDRQKQDRRRAALARRGLKIHAVVVPVDRVDDLMGYAADLVAEHEGRAALVLGQDERLEVVLQRQQRGDDHDVSDA